MTATAYVNRAGRALAPLLLAAWTALAGCSADSANPTGSLEEAQALPALHQLARAPQGVAPDDYVVTPHGYFHASCVVELGADEHQRADGLLERSSGAVRAAPPCRYARYDKRGRAFAPDAVGDDAPPARVDGWVESSSDASHGAIGFISANWQVPPAPAVDSGQVIYYFPGLEDISNVQTIVQPVLGWYSGGWTIASWNCCKDGNVFHSDFVGVRSGDTLYGYAQGSNCDGNGHCPNWTVYTGDQSTGQSTTLNTSSYGQIFDWSFGAVLEAYGVDHCAQYPASGAATFYNINVRRTNGAGVGINWPSGTGGGSPNCGYVFTASGNAVTLSSTATRAATPAAPSGCGTLKAGQGLIPGRSLKSCDGRFHLDLQLDGNLVLYQGGAALWSTNSWGSNGFSAVQQSDGNFVLYNMSNNAMWAAGTWGHSGSRLALQNDGNLVVYDSANRALWASNTCCR